MNHDHDTTHGELPCKIVKIDNTDTNTRIDLSYGDDPKRGSTTDGVDGNPKATSVISPSDMGEDDGIEPGFNASYSSDAEDEAIEGKEDEEGRERGNGVLPLVDLYRPFYIRQAQLLYLEQSGSSLVLRSYSTRLEQQWKLTDDKNSLLQNVSTGDVLTVVPIEQDQDFCSSSSSPMCVRMKGVELHWKLVSLEKYGNELARHCSSPLQQHTWSINSARGLMLHVATQGVLTSFCMEKPSSLADHPKFDVVISADPLDGVEHWEFLASNTIESLNLHSRPFHMNRESLTSTVVNNDLSSTHTPSTSDKRTPSIGNEDVIIDEYFKQFLNVTQDPSTIKLQEGYVMFRETGSFRKNRRRFFILTKDSKLSLYPDHARHSTPVLELDLKTDISFFNDKSRNKLCLGLVTKSKHAYTMVFNGYEEFKSFKKALTSAGAKEVDQSVARRSSTFFAPSRLFQSPTSTARSRIEINGTTEKENKLYSYLKTH